jgi:putative pyruvate formate lyase activating enzyme
LKDYPKYLKIFKEKGFEKKITTGTKLLKNCTVCPRKCNVNRLNGELGECRTGNEPIVSSHFAHFGEEAPLVGNQGSGTIFIAGCNLLCLFCQNYDLSHNLNGRPVSIKRFAEMMLELQEAGCHNINIVTPSHVVPQLIEAIHLATRNGLRLPIVYNSSGYDNLISLNLLNNLIDIYMPDFKFYSNVLGAKYTAVSNYATVAKKAIKEMHKQVGDLIIENGIAKRGLLIRHLVMPGMLEDSKKIFQFISSEISKKTYVNVMPQYRPSGEARNYPEIDHPLHYSEFLQAINLAKEAGLERLDKFD